jgi:hypothetical protein
MYAHEERQEGAESFTSASISISSRYLDKQIKKQTFRVSTLKQNLYLENILTLTSILS